MKKYGIFLLLLLLVNMVSAANITGDAQFFFTFNPGTYTGSQIGDETGRYACTSTGTIQSHNALEGQSFNVSSAGTSVCRNATNIPSEVLTYQFWLRPPNNINQTASQSIHLARNDSVVPFHHICTGSCAGQFGNEVITVYDGSGLADSAWYWTDVDGFGLTAQTWHQIVIVNETTNLRLYVNGINRGLAIINLAPGGFYTRANRPFYLGGIPGFGTADTNTMYDCVSAWNQSLNSTEVFSLYGQGGSCINPFRATTIRVYNEETWQLINDREIILDVINEAASANDTTSTAFFSSTLPTSINGSTTFVFRASGYETRYYIETIDPTISQSFYVTMLNSSSSTDLTITVQDETSSVISGAEVWVGIYNITENDYLPVQKLTTNDEGQALANVQLNDDLYRFGVFINGLLVLNTTPSQILSTSKILKVTLGGLPFQDVENTTSLTYNFTPIGNVLNGTNGTFFTFNISSTYWNLTSCNFAIRNASNNALHNSTSGFCTAQGGSASLGYVTITGENLLVVANWTTSQGTFGSNRYYVVIDLNQSRFTFATSLDDLSSFQGSGFNNASRILLTLIVILGVAYTASKGQDVLGQGESTVLLMFFVSLIASYAGLLDLGLPFLPVPEVGQYLITFILGMFALVIGWRRIGVLT